MAYHIYVALDVSAAELLTSDAYGTGAKLRLESATTETGSYTELSTTTIVTGTQGYEFWDATGTATTWYRWRVSNTGGTVFSPYSAAFQVTDDQYVTLDIVKERLGLTTATDDATLGRFLMAAGRFMSNRIGLFLGPSTDTVRTYDGHDADCDVLWIPGGIRAFTLIEVADGTGETFETVTSGDILIRPKAHLLPPGEPGSWLQFSDNPTGDWGSWPSGYDNIRITGTFGWREVPEDLAELAARLTQRYWLARSSGQADVVGSDALGNAVVSRFMARVDYQILDGYRDRVRARAS